LIRSAFGKNYYQRSRQEEGSIQMMDRERREKERQEVFTATWRSYRAAVENAFALQERTLEFARSLLESPAGALRAQSENNRAALDALAEQSRRQREALENLVRESANAYVNLIQAPFSYYQEVVEAITSPWTSPRGGPESQAEDDPPLEGHDSMNVREVSDKLGELSVEEIRQLRDYEIRNKNRRTLLDRFNARIEAGSS
jgi:hypothetical protein